MGEVESAGGVGEGGAQAAAVLLDDAVDAEVEPDAFRLFRDPGDVEGAGVPPERECAAWAQDAEGFRDRSGRVGPVPGLGVGEEVEGVGGEGEGVAVAPHDRDVGEGAAELGRHALAGFDRDHFGASGVQ